MAEGQLSLIAGDSFISRLVEHNRQLEAKGVKMAHFVIDGMVSSVIHIPGGSVKDVAFKITDGVVAGGMPFSAYRMIVISCGGNDLAQAANTLEMACYMTANTFSCFKLSLLTSHKYTCLQYRWHIVLI